VNSDRDPILVVSDTHFGRGLPSQLSCRHVEFTKFLEWVIQDRTLVPLDGSFSTPGVLTFPRKMILLGDILELWAPLSERLVFETAYAPLAKLQEVGAKGCEIIYVAGNHDYTISEYEGQHAMTNVACVPSLRVVEDTYSDGRYVFLHGHQLDKAFRLPVWRMLGFIHGLVAAFGKTLERAIVISLFLVAVAWFFSRVEVLLQILFALGVLTAFIFIREAAFPAFVLGKRLDKLAQKAKEWMYGRMSRRPQFKEFAEIIDEGSLQLWWNEHKGKFEEDPEVIVFGHTHMAQGPIKVEEVPGIEPSKVDVELRTKTLVNTGGWLKEEDEDCTSFLYVTEKDEILLCGYNADENLGVELPRDLAPFASRLMPWSAPPSQPHP